jgi:hypothetical protein
MIHLVALIGRRLDEDISLGFLPCEVKVREVIGMLAH